jgi:hypothetical protein
MASGGRVSLAAFLAFLMMSQVVSAGLSVWSGPNSVSGASDSVSDGFRVPGNATVVDAWLHVDETGATSDGTGLTWTGEDVPGNFSAGQFQNTIQGKFADSLSLSPDSSVSNVETFTSGTLQLAGGWSTTGNIWGATNPSGLGGTISGPSQTMPYGVIPAAAADGGVVAATLAGQGLPANSVGTLSTSAIPLPSPLNHFNFTMEHWYHLDSGLNGGGDGAWFEIKLDNGAWTYIEPVGGYPSTISTNASVPNGANGSGFPVFAAQNHSGWVSSIFSLDNVSGILNATTMDMRFKIWTDSNSTSRPGWFIDDLELTNVGNSVGFWHHGCSVPVGSTCGYSNSADGMLISFIDLSNTSNGSKIQTRLEWDLEGSTYDNFCVELSPDNGTTWYDISSNTGGSTSTGCRSRTGAIPGSGYTLSNGTTLQDESGMFVNLEFSIPSQAQGASNGKIKYYVETDTSVTNGGTADNLEGLTLDWFKVVASNGTVLDVNNFDNSSSAWHFGSAGGADDWQFIQIGAGGFTGTDSFEDSQSLPPGGWTVSNVNGQAGWQFGAVCSNYTDGPSAFPSPSIGFGTNLCGDYDSSSDNELITPSYSVPLGASARFVWKHWMCAEQTWDGGALFYSLNGGGSWTQAYVNYANGTNWYDGVMTSGGSQSLYNTDVWDGRNHQTFSCSSTSLTPWQDMAFDVSNFSGNNITFKFVFSSDSAVQEPGWYIDNIGLEVDWFETQGEWISPLITPHDLGYGFVDADLILPNNTWYGISVLDMSGSVIPGHENRTLPLSLASIDLDTYSSIRIRIDMGTNDEYFTPLFKKLSVGATRYFGADNGWSIPAGIEQNTTGSWVNTGGVTATITGDSGISTRPLKLVDITGNFSQATVGVLTNLGNWDSATTTNSTLDLGGMASALIPKVTLSPGGIIDSVQFTGEFVQPAHDASIDLADDGVEDWAFGGAAKYGSFGWQTQMDRTSSIHSVDIIGNSTLSILIPSDALVHTLVLGLNPTASAGFSISESSNYLSSFADNWTATSISYDLNNPTLTHSLTDSTGRNWSTLDLVFVGKDAEFNIGSFAMGYTLFENVSGLGNIVKSYHVANSNNGQVSIVGVPLTWTASAGGVGIDGGVYHENMITNHPFTVPETWYPTGELQGFTTSHHHLLDNDEIAEVHLIGIDSSGDEIRVVLTNLTNGGTFTQSSGFAMLKVDNSTSLSLVNGRWVIDWQFEVDWDWNDSTSMAWTAQAYDHDGEGLSPASAMSGGVGTQASENDLMVDSWKVLDEYGHTLSDVFSPSYPFWAKTGSQVFISGSVKFQNTLDLRPQSSDYVVAISVSGQQFIMGSTPDGTWSGFVNLPLNSTNSSLVPSVLRTGPIEGASGAEDRTIQNPVQVLLDGESPWVKDLQVNNGQRLLDADGYTWDPSDPLSIQVTITDNQALGSSLTLHYWREGIDDEGHYQTMNRSTPEGISGERTLIFTGFNLDGMAVNGQLSLWFSAVDYAGLPLMYGGSEGVDNDMATMIIAVNEPTEIDSNTLGLDTHNDYLLVGQNHTLSIEISDENGVESIDMVVIQMLGSEEEKVGVMVWEPRNGAMYSPSGSQLSLNSVDITEGEQSYLVEFNFVLDWDFDISLLDEYSLPSIIVYDDDDLNPVALLTNIGELRWRIDNNLRVVVAQMSDNTPPISQSDSEIIFVQPGDDITVNGWVEFVGSGLKIETLPPQGLNVYANTMYGSEELEGLSMLNPDGTWSISLILPSRSLIEGLLDLEFEIEGVVSPGFDATTLQTNIVVDDIIPIVVYSSVPLAVTDEELIVMPFTISVEESGGMPEGDLTVHWAFLRNGLILPDGESSAQLPYISDGAGMWSYVGSLDFTEGVNVSLEEGDSLIWWIDVIDKAGNSPTGTGLSKLDPMGPKFTVLSFDLTVTNIEISLANGSTPRGNQVVEGTEIGVTVYVRNLGTKSGTVSVSLMEDLKSDRNWLAQNVVEITLAPGQTLPLEVLLFETHGSGPQNLAINLTGMNRWIDNVMLPHCSGFAGNASCDLNVETDMPNVISTEEARSGTSGSSLIMIILGLIVAGMGVALVIVLKRKDGDSSVFYDDEWDESEEDQYLDKYQAEKTTPILPPIKPSMPRGEIEPPIEELAIEETAEVEIEDDPWDNVDHSEEE